MTIHKAKGLEFDCVIVPALHRHNRVAGGPMLLMHPVRAQRARRHGHGGPAADRRARQPARLFDFLAPASIRGRAARGRASSVRRVHPREAPAASDRDGRLAGGPGLDRRAHRGRGMPRSRRERGCAPAEGAKPWSPFKGSLLGCFGRRRSELRGRRAGADAEPDADPAGLRGGPLRRVPRGLGAAPRTCRCKPICRSLTAAREEPVVFDWAGETARRVGILVHAELQRLDLDRSDETRHSLARDAFQALARAARRA